MTQLEALLLSLLIEVPVVLGVAVVGGWLPGERTRLAAIATAATLLTHPVVWNAWFVLQPHLGWTATAALLEGSAVVVEAGVYAGFGLSPRRALLVSFVANATSFGIGLRI